MLNELEELESGDDTATKPRRQNGGRNSSHRGKPHQGGKSGNYDRSERGNSGYAGGENFRNRNNNSGRDNTSGDKTPYSKPHNKYKGKPHSGKKGNASQHGNGNPAPKNKGE